MSVEIAFYKGKSKRSIPNMVFTKLIKIWTQCPYSHTELVIKHGADPTTWRWFSSTDNGPRGATIDFHEENWDFVELPYFNVTDSIEFIENQYGMGYDWWGIILSQLFKTRLDDRQKWFCSELIYAALVEGKCLEGEDASYNPASVSPKKLFELVA